MNTMTSSQANVLAGARRSLMRRATRKNASRKPAIAERWARKPPGRKLPMR